MKDLPEKPLLGHVESGELEEIIYAVLELHAVLACALRSVDKIPYLLHVHGCRHLYGHMLAMFHGIRGHHHMGLPVGGDIHEVYVIPLAELLPHLLVAAVCNSLVAAVLLEDVLAFLHILRLSVAQGHDIGTFNLAHAVNGPWSAHTQSDEADTYCFKGRSRKAEHILLSGRSFRDFGPDDGVSVLTLAGTQGQHADRKSQRNSGKFFHGLKIIY